MTPEELYNLINGIIDKATGVFGKNATAAQGRMWSHLFNKIRKLETDAAGNILINRNNLRSLRDIQPELIRAAIDKKYRKGVNKLTGRFQNLKNTNDSYLGAFSGFNANKDIYKAPLNLSVDLTKNSLLRSGIEANVINPVLNTLNQAVTTGSNITDMTDNLRTFIKGSDVVNGKLESYAGQITRDGLNQFNANYNLTVSQDLKIEWYSYQGALVETSRDYCKRRAGQIFHITEIKKSAGEIWAGKIPGTNPSNILVVRGGYNCNHQYIPVPKDAVPKNKLNKFEI